MEFNNWALKFPFYEHFHVPTARFQNDFSTLPWELITDIFTGKFWMFHPEWLFFFPQQKPLKDHRISRSLLMDVNLFVL